MAGHVWLRSGCCQEVLYTCTVGTWILEVESRLGGSTFHASLARLGTRRRPCMRHDMAIMNPSKDNEVQYFIANDLSRQ